jgi:hypothetical protein
VLPAPDCAIALVAPRTTPARVATVANTARFIAISLITSMADHSPCLSMILSENRCTLFGIMLDARMAWPGVLNA